MRVMRGGSWYTDIYSDYVRAAARSYDKPDIRFDILGFRCARSP